MEIDDCRRLDAAHVLRLSLGALLLGAGGMLGSCNTHPVSYQPASGSVDRVENTSVGGGAAVDILWVIDNSGSMCQEQKQLRDNFRSFIDQLGGEAVDFNIAVTTTEYDAGTSGSGDSVAQPGQIQSTPSPVTGALPACRYKDDSRGRPISPNYRNEVENPDEGVSGPDYDPVRKQVQRAVECTKNPEKWRKELNSNNLSRNRIQCELEFSADACNSVDSIDDGEAYANEKASVRNLFPPQSAYRNIDKVLSTGDYTSGGNLNKDKLVDDFSCMSFVGTRGQSKEQGLRSAVRAVDPEVTGGPVDLNESERASYDPNGDGQSDYNPDAPNHGFIRRNANFALIFVTDEDDCSLQAGQSLPDKQGCVDRECYFLTKKEDPSPLQNVGDMQNQFIKNLAQSKGLTYDPNNPTAPDTLNPNNVLAASIHGTADPTSVSDKNPVTDPENQQCTEAGDTFVKPVCSGRLGEAFTGGRYEDFIRKFERFFPQPDPNDPDKPLEGKICQNDLQSAIDAIATFIEPAPRDCIPGNILPCRQEEACPPYAFPAASNSGSGMGPSPNGSPPDTGNICIEKGNNQFCKSAIQVRIFAPEDADNPEQLLGNLGPSQNSKYCYPASIGAEGLENGCVVKRSFYEWSACDREDSSGLLISWNDPTQVKRDLEAFDVRIRYTEEITGSGDESSDAGTSGGSGGEQNANGGGGGNSSGTQGSNNR